MSTLIDQADPAEPAQHFVFHDVSWAYYEQTLAEIGNQSIRVAYLDGVMEIMSPLPRHERPTMALSQLITNLAIERRIRYTCFGSTTFRREEKSAGSEPDDCFYFNEVDSVKTMEHFDPQLYRAPDLWVEVDLTNSSVPREPICARLAVPEIWRYENRKLNIRLLGLNGIYAESAKSLIFPFLPLMEFSAFVQKMLEGDQMQVSLDFRQWAANLPK